MRIRAGVVLIENEQVALIERFREGRHYYVFPGGGADEGETPQAAAVREMEEETGLRVTVKGKLIEIRFWLSTQHYYLAERVSGKYGTGVGEEYDQAAPQDPNQGVYIPVWMPLADLTDHENIYPVEVKELVSKSLQEGWPQEPPVVDKHPR